jgi:hypothetical protein
MKEAKIPLNSDKNLFPWEPPEIVGIPGGVG